MTILALLFLCLSVDSDASYEQNIANDTPIAWWRLDETRYKDGFPAVDKTGDISSATYQGDAMTVSGGIDGKCGWFSGNQAGIDIGNELGPWLDNAPAITFEAWIHPCFLIEGNPIQRIFTTRIHNGGAGFEVGMGVSNGQGYISVSPRSSVIDPYRMITANFSDTNSWSHLTCIADYAAGNVKIYLNGTLAQSSSIDFAYNHYLFGNPTERDQLGRANSEQYPYRGYIDEVAIYDYALSTNQITAHYSAGSPAQPTDLWISEISDEGAAGGPYLGSPSILQFSDGTLVATHDYFGTNSPVPSGTSAVKASSNNGQTWSSRGLISGVVTASLFEHKGDLYAFGSAAGKITIAKSTDNGSTWTTPVNSTNGLLFTSTYGEALGHHTGPVPVIFANGRVYRAYEKVVSTNEWPTAFAAVIISADENDDLLDASNWTMTGAVEFDPIWIDPDWGWENPGWLEGNVVETPDGDIALLMRVNTDPAVGVAAILHLSQDNTTLSFDPEIGFIDMPGARHKFDIHRDPVTGTYLTFNNNNTDISWPVQRNTLSLIASDDLLTWTHARTVIQDNSPTTWRDSKFNTGFQYIKWDIHGDDIFFISRTAYDGADNFHDTNKMTFHRLEGFRNFIPKTLFADGFETDFTKWTDGGVTDWSYWTIVKHYGSRSACADSYDTDLISDNIDTTGYASMEITFWYNDDDIDDSDDVYLQFYNGSSYINRIELGNTSTEDTWHKCKITLYNSGSEAQYFRSNFRLKFPAESIDPGEHLWLDDVRVIAHDF